MSERSVVFGIANCDQVRKTRAWFAQRGQAIEFRDFKRDGVEPTSLQRWIEDHGLDAILNRRGTTWRALDARTRDAADSRDGAIALMRAHPSLIKRPIVEIGPHVIVGFAPEQWTRISPA